VRRGHHRRALLRGYGHQSFIVRPTARGALLLKIALRGDQLAKMKSLCHVLEIASRHGIPAPRLLHFSEGTGTFGGRPWLVQEFLEGEDGESAIEKMNGAERAVFFEDFGRAVAQLHAVDLGYFAEEFASGRREETWTALVEARLAQVEERHRRVPVLARERLERARDTIRTAARAVALQVRPSLVHRDLYLPNTLTTAGRFRGLLDFEHARSTDAVTDFVKLRMWVFEAIPDAEEPFLAGYGAALLATNDGGARYQVALGLELLSGLVYFTTSGQPAMVEDYLRRLTDYLHAGRPR
jgi:aminoglycoside phosphotransferase (APT) family kinase protein